MSHDLQSSERQDIDWVIPGVIGGIGVFIGILGFENKTEPLGAVAMGAGSSLVGASLVMLLREIL